MTDVETVRVRRLCVAFAAVFLFGVWLSDWRYVFESDSHAKAAVPEPTEDEPPMPTITTPDEFDIAIASRRCVVFVDAHWSPTAVLVRRDVVYPAIRRWKSMPQAASVSFFRMDMALKGGAGYELIGRKLVPMVRPAANVNDSGQVFFFLEGTLVDFIDPDMSETRAALSERIAHFSQL